MDVVTLNEVFSEFEPIAKPYTLRVWAREGKIPKVFWHDARAWCKETDVESVREYLRKKVTSEKFVRASVRARAIVEMRKHRTKPTPPPSLMTEQSKMPVVFDDECKEALVGIFKLCRVISLDVNLLRQILPELQALKDSWR